MGLRTPIHTGYVNSYVGQAKAWCFAPLRPGEALIETEMDVSVQMDRLLQDVYCPPLVVDTGLFLVPLTLLQSEYGDDYIRAFAGEFPTTGTQLYAARTQTAVTAPYVAWDRLKYDLLAEVCRTYFSREFAQDAPIGFKDSYFVGSEFLPTAAGEYTETLSDSAITESDVLDIINEIKQERLAETTYLESLHRFGVSGREARHIPEVVAWERRLMHPRRFTS